MRAQCDECTHLYKNKRTLKEHQRQTGHKQGNIEGNIAKLSDVVKVQTELYEKSKLIAKLDDSLKAKDADIAKLNDEFASLHDDIAKLNSQEHEDDIIRERLQGLTRDAYDKLGESLGFLNNGNIEAKIGKIEGKTSLHDESSVLIGKEECAETEGEKFWRELNEALNKEKGRPRG